MSSFLLALLLAPAVVVVQGFGHFQAPGWAPKGNYWCTESDDRAYWIYHKEGGPCPVSFAQDGQAVLNGVAFFCSARKLLLPRRTST